MRKFEIIKNSILNWSTFTTPHIGNVILSQELLINTIDLFNTEVMLKLAPNTHILFIPRLKLENGEFITLSKMLRLNKDDIDFLSS